MNDETRLIRQPIPADKENKTFVDACEQILNDSSRVSIACPYLSQEIVRHLTTRPFKLITDLDECFGRKVDSELTDLFRQNLNCIRFCEGLHAKVLIGSKKGLFGSANFTKAGFTQHFEVSCMVGGELLKELADWFEELWNVSEKIDPQEFDERIKKLSSRPKAEPSSTESRRSLKTKTGSLASWEIRDKTEAENAAVNNHIGPSKNKSERPQVNPESLPLDHSSAGSWWFGVNNQKRSKLKSGHVALDEIQPFWAGEEPSFKWNFGNSKTVPSRAYESMHPGDRVIVWTGRGPYEENWGLIGTAVIESIDLEQKYLLLGQGKRFQKSLTPYSAKEKNPKENENIRFLFEVFGEEFTPLGDIRHVIYNKKRKTLSLSQTLMILHALKKLFTIWKNKRASLHKDGRFERC